MKFLAFVCVFLLVGSVCCMRRRRQAVAPAADEPDTPGMNAALGFMVDELEKEKALGGPVNPQGLQKANNLALKIELLGGDVDADTQTKLSGLVSEAAAQPGFGQYLSKPEDTKVNAPMQGP